MADFIDVATYGRNSDPKQDTSQEIQADEFYRFATSDAFKRLFGKPANIIKDYKDHGKSASKKKSKRVDFDRMLSESATAQWKAVLILNTSRFCRQHPKHALKFIMLLEGNGKFLVDIEQEKIIQTDELGDLLATIVKFNSDHEYARSVAANTLRGTMLKIKTEATCHQNHIPYGMAKLVTTDTGEQRVYPRTNNIRIPETWKGYLVPGDEVEQDVVRWIFTTYVDDDVSFCEIARRLNNHKNAAWRIGPKGGRWNPRTLRFMLLNRHYRAQEFIGNVPTGEHYRCVNGQAVETKKAKEIKPLVVDGKYPPVVEPAIFEKAKAKIDRKKGSKPKCTGEFSLTGSVYCGHCGHVMLSTSNRGCGARFRCTSSQGGYTDCKTYSISEAEVLPWLFARIDKELLKRLQDNPDSQAKTDTEVVRKQITNIDAKIAAIQADIASPLTTIEQCRTHQATINKLIIQKERLQTDLHDETHEERQEAAYEQWLRMTEFLVGKPDNNEGDEVDRLADYAWNDEPRLVGIRTGEVGEGVEAVETLGLKEEIDRLFNFTYARPSRIRELLQSMDARVTCYFKPKASASGTQRLHYDLDHGAVEVTIQGVSRKLPQGNVEQSAPAR